MAKRIAIIQGHPDPSGGHLCHALADAYAEGARRNGHEVETVDVPALSFPLLRTESAFDHDAPPADIATAQKTIEWADHLLIVYPLWLGAMPALLKGFFEQTFRPGFAVASREDRIPKPLLRGRSARIVVTMGMPSLIYRWIYRAHSLRNLERSILKFAGISPNRHTLFGGVGVARPATRAKWLEKMSALGARAR